jgi:NADP-dependent 3-hydroxy acid dehydrogenase YdfG
LRSDRKALWSTNGSGSDVEHVARGVVYMATLPLEANVQFMTVMATKMPYIGRG